MWPALYLGPGDDRNEKPRGPRSPCAARAAVERVPFVHNSTGRGARHPSRFHRDFSRLPPRSRDGSVRRSDRAWSPGDRGTFRRRINPWTG